MKNRNYITLALVAVLAITTLVLGGCSRVRILDADSTTLVGFERSVLADTVEADVGQGESVQEDAQDRSEGAEQAAVQQPVQQPATTPPPTTSQPAMVAQNNSAPRTSSSNNGASLTTIVINARESSNASADAPDYSSTVEEGPHEDGQNAQPQEGEQSNVGEGPGEEGQAPGDAPADSGTDVNQETLPDGQGEAQKNSTEESDRAQAIQSQLAAVKSSITGADSLRCLAKNAYVEMEGDYIVASRATNMGQAVALPQITNIGFDKYDPASDLWVVDRADNIDLIVKAVPAGVLGSGVWDTGAAAAVAEQLKSRPEWGAITAVRNNAIVLVSAEFADTEIGARVLSAYLGAMAYPSMYATEELQFGDPAALYQAITGDSLDGIYFYPQTPSFMEEVY